jgi:hypothetical protein
VHQLFPAPENAPDDWKPVDPNEVAEIKVFHRLGGRRLLIPGPFGPHDIPDDAAFYAKFGGGSFELVATRLNGQVYRRRSVEFAGSPTYATALSQGAATVGAAPAQPSAFASGPVIAAAITAVVSLVTAWMSHSREVAAREEAQRTALMTMMASNGTAGNAQAMDLVKALLARATPPATPSTPAPSLVDQLKAHREILDELKKAGKASGVDESEWLRALEAIGPTALQVLGPILAAKFMPGGMPLMPPMPGMEPPLIKVVPG